MDAKFIVGALLVLAIAYYFFVGRRAGTSGEDARALVERGAQLVDVRTAEEFANGHLDGAINVPVQELSRRIGELGPTERTIVVYCRSGARSAHAAELLRSAGFTEIHDLGAMSRW